MAEPYSGSGYKIWLNNRKTNDRITEENIWVGNTPGDGKSKSTSRSQPYVIFDNWEDLLEAAGVLERITISYGLKQTGCEDCINPQPVAISVTTSFEQVGCGCLNPDEMHVTVTTSFEQSGCEDDN